MLRAVLGFAALLSIVGCSGQGPTVDENEAALQGGNSCHIGKAKYQRGDLNPANACQVCDPSRDNQGWSNVSDGTACNDGSACTRTDSCHAGTCVGATPVVCMPLDQCHIAGSCNPANGVCSNPQKADCSVIPPNGGSVAIGAGGGTILTTDGSLKLSFPPGALPSATAISVAVASQPDTDGVVGTAYQLQPEGLVFATPATITLAYTRSKLPSWAGEDEIGIIHSTTGGDGLWDEPPASSLDVTNQTVSAQIRHFSVWVPAIKTSKLKAGTTKAVVTKGKSIPLQPTVHLSKQAMALAKRKHAYVPPPIATVTPDGVVTGTDVGTGSIGVTAGSASAAIDVSVVAPPAIASFTSADATITQGQSTTLTAVFSDGTGVLDGAVSIVSGAPQIVAPTSTTTYNLVVTNAAGDSVTASVAVIVVPPPRIDSFTAARTVITAGTSTLLTAQFAGGVGVITPGELSGAASNVVAPTTTTTYTLTVTNAAGMSTTATATVTVVPPPSISSFVATPSVITAGTAVALTAQFVDGVGSIMPDHVNVNPGQPFSVVPTTTTTYTLTVTNSARDSVTASVTVTVLTGCSPGYADCNGNPADGCETVTNTTSNCGGCGVVCSAPAGASASCQGGSHCVVTGDAAHLAQWQIQTNDSLLAVWPDGRIFAQNNYPQHALRIDPRTGSYVSVQPFGSRPSIWNPITASGSPQLDGNGVARLPVVVGGYQDRWARFENDTAAWSWLMLGCCDVFLSPIVVDTVGASGYQSGNSTLYRLDLGTGALIGTSSLPTFAGTDSIDAPNYFVAGWDGRVAKVLLGDQPQSLWSVQVDPTEPVTTDGRLRPGAIAADGSFVVTSTNGYFARLVDTGSHVAWTNMFPGVTAPVISATGTIYVAFGTRDASGTAHAQVAGFDPATGNAIWSHPLPGVPSEILLGDDNRVYIAFSDVNQIVGFDTTNHAQIATLQYDNLPGTVNEMLIHNGALIASLSNPQGGSIISLPIPATAYQANAPWPVRFHDNQRTSNRQAVAPVFLPCDPAAMPFGGGNGTTSDPWRLCSAAHLAAIAGALDGHYSLSDDVSLSGVAWTPIGTVDQPFTGTLQGGGHAIAGLSIQQPGVSSVGFFGAIGASASVSNVVFNSASVFGNNWAGILAGTNLGLVSGCAANGGSVGAYDYSGGLVGDNAGTIASSSVSGLVMNNHHAGGLVSRNRGTIVGAATSGTMNIMADTCGGVAAINAAGATVSRSHSSFNITCAHRTGGIVGENLGTIDRCYATGALSIQGLGVGGIAGQHDSGDIRDSYSTASVNGFFWCIGGLVGQGGGTIERAYASGAVTSDSSSTTTGGLVGCPGGSAVDAFWDIDVTGQATSAAGTGLTHAQMLDASSFPSFDFVQVWQTTSGSLPTLR